MLTAICRSNSGSWIWPKQNFSDDNFLKVRTYKNKKDESYSLNSGVRRQLCDDDAAGSEF
jgi:hypothetical protein